MTDNDDQPSWHIPDTERIKARHRIREARALLNKTTNADEESEEKPVQ